MTLLRAKHRSEVTAEMWPSSSCHHPLTRLVCCTDVQHDASLPYINPRSAAAGGNQGSPPLPPSPFPQPSPPAVDSPGLLLDVNETV